LAHAIDRWLSEVVKGRKSEEETTSKANIVRELAGHIPTARITEALDLIEERSRGEGELSRATINRRRAVLKAVAKFAWRKGWVGENLSGKIPLLAGEVQRKRLISAAEIGKLITKAPDAETKAFIALAGYAGLRQGEVMALEKAHATKTAITVMDSKTGRPRVVPVVPALRPHLKALPLTSHKRTLYGRFLQACEAAGIRNLVYHDLRRSAATILLNAGADLATVAHVMGHRSLETTRKVYAMVLDRTAQSAMLKAFPSASPSGKRPAKKARLSA
jgi:integrase